MIHYFPRNDDSCRSRSFLVAASSCRPCLHGSRVNKRLPKGLPGIRKRLGERFSSLVRDIQRQAGSGLAPLGVSLRHVKSTSPDGSGSRLSQSTVSHDRKVRVLATSPRFETGAARDVAGWRKPVSYANFTGLLRKTSLLAIGVVSP